MNGSYNLSESIQVKNVGALHDTGLVVISPLTLFIGDSASGKSTLMKIIVLMRFIYKRVNIRSYIKNANVDEKLFYIRFKDLLRDDIKQLVDNKSYIEYRIEVNGHPYFIKYENGKLLTPDSIPNEDLVFSKEVWMSEMRSAIAPLSSRGSLAKNASLGFYFDETFNEFDIATDAMKRFNLSYVGLDMEVAKGGNNQKKIILKPKDGSYSSFELRHASSGIQTTAPLLAMVNYFATEFSFKAAQKRNIIDFLFEKDLTTKYHPEMELADIPGYVHLHIEEPELSLDPTSQLHFFNEIVRQSFYGTADDRNMGLVITTHSPYMVNHLNLLIKAHDCNTEIDGAHLDYGMLSIYHIQGGCLRDLKLQNMHFVNTDRLSQDINDIYDKYEQLRTQSK